MSYCSHCGSTNVHTENTSNGGLIYVAEDVSCATECYDPDIEMLECDDCGSTTYKSV